MRKHTVILTVILLSLASMNVMAEWTYLTSNNISDYYVDKSDIRKNGTTVKMWDMVDFKSVQKHPNKKLFLSMKEFAEYDCEEVRYANLRLIYFSGNTGEGEVVFSYQYDREWVDIAPDTISKAIWKTACDKK